jgi:hypothetical protein
VTGILAGILADLVGHKAVTDWKGFRGVKACLECGNLFQYRRLKSGQISLTCFDTRKFKKHTNESLWAIVDELRRAKTRVSATKFAALETDLGLNYNPDGLMFDDELRKCYLPANHMLRDWMHTLGQDGVANTHIACAIYALDESGVPPERIINFAELCRYPSKWGKLDKWAFSPKRLRDETIVSFASTILTMVPVFHLFLDMFAKDILPQHFKCFTYLHHIVGILRTGPDTAPQFIDTLRTLMERHFELFQELYDANIKPKMHHLFHVIDHMEWLGKLLSCFVTERKHRDVKHSALYVFRHIEHTVLADVVNKAIEQVIDGFDLYKVQFMVRPTAAEIAGHAFRRSSHIVAIIGPLAAGDMVITHDGVVGSIIGFWQQSDDATIYAEIDAHECIGNNTQVRSMYRTQRMFIDIAMIVDALIWVMESPAIIRISIPPAMLYS